MLRALHECEHLKNAKNTAVANFEYKIKYRLMIKKLKRD